MSKNPVNNGSGDFIIDPHPETDDLTLGELRKAYKINEEAILSAKQQGGNKGFLSWRIIRRRILAKAIKGHERALCGVSSSPGIEKDDLPLLDAGDHDLARISDLALKYLDEANDPPTIFRHGDYISRIRKADDGAMVIQSVSERSLRGALARSINWYEKKKNKVIAALPPVHVVRDILAKPSLPFPVLTRVVRSPVFAADGTLTIKAGYSFEGKLYYDPPDGFDLAPVPQQPDPDDVAFAKGQLEDILFDFPFVGISLNSASDFVP